MANEDDTKSVTQGAVTDNEVYNATLKAFGAMQAWVNGKSDTAYAKYVAAHNEALRKYKAQGAR